MEDSTYVPRKEEADKFAHAEPCVCEDVSVIVVDDDVDQARRLRQIAGGGLTLTLTAAAAGRL